MSGTPKSFRVAAVQMCSGARVDENLRVAGGYLAEAAAAGAMMAFLPENFAFMGLEESDRLRVAEREGDGPIQEFLSRTARERGLWIVAGTLPLRAARPDRCRSSCLVYDDRGRRVARYDKMHLFDVGVPDSDEAYTESATLCPGERAALCATPLGRIGLSVCYDVRFPELYRQLAAAGAVLMSVPSAFTAATGRRHWDTLLRARAIENLSYVVAAGQAGRHENGRETWGHSLIIGPWGDTLAELASGTGVITALVEPARLSALRRRFPALEHRRIGWDGELDVYTGGPD